MKTQISSWNPDLAISSNCNYIEKAWHLASILLSLRRPASTHEIAAKCLLFRTTPEFVRFLCSIPNSPIYLFASNFVGLSASYCCAFGEFFAQSRPKIDLRLYGDEKLSRYCIDLPLTYFRKRKRFEDKMMPIVKKRAVLRSIDENVPETANSSAVQRLVSIYCEGVDLQCAYPGTSLTAVSTSRLPAEVNPVIISDMVASLTTPSLVNSSIGLFEYQLDYDNQERGNEQITHVANDMDKCLAMVEHKVDKDKFYANEIFLDLLDYDNKIPEASVDERVAELSAILLDRTDHDLKIKEFRVDADDPFGVELNVRNSMVQPTAVIKAANNLRQSQTYKTKMLDLNEQPSMDNDGPEVKVENIALGSCAEVSLSADKLQQTDMETVRKTYTKKEELTDSKPTKATKPPLVSAGPQLSAQKPSIKLLEPTNIPQAELTLKQPIPNKLMHHNKLDIIHKEHGGQNHRIVMAMMDKPKPIAKNNMSIPERCDNAQKSSKDKQKSKFPEFEPYTVEEEEGSGGYGTVYRARRNSDGLTFAIKCPHENAQKLHFKNELKMLERFGGKNFVIKYEGSLKSESSDCFVLEHVEHDRPEILKKEIDTYQLQFYGYCMFRALASLHKQGVFHRDIKPGNFLFSRKTRTGYLIDFNLAKDMNQKHGNMEKAQHCNVTDIQQNSSAHFKSTSPNRRKKFLGGKSSELFKAGASSGSNYSLENKALKKKDLDNVKACKDLGRCNSLTSQGADGSGITSTRDMTSARAPSAERLRKPQPLFCKGRKELFSLAQKAMQSPNTGAVKAPSSNRKRVAASPGITDRKFIYPTPTPLHSSGAVIMGAGSLKNKGDVKPVKDGLCAGTKGFRAPEVLLRSLHQGPKVDVWSAGVTLLYLISGRMPFNGDPEQNMKEIVNMKGNEELWEVAKLHNRESSFPMELLDIRYLQSMTVKDWYRANTKRQDLLEVIPDSLFDLLEKCLTVNPRLRITAEDALNHEFFGAMLKKKLVRRGQDSKNNSLPLLCEPVRPLKEKLIAPVNF